MLNELGQTQETAECMIPFMILDILICPEMAI